MPASGQTLTSRRLEVRSDDDWNPPSVTTRDRV